jgi:hypothetical protein
MHANDHDQRADRRWQCTLFPGQRNLNLFADAC